MKKLTILLLSLAIAGCSGTNEVKDSGKEVTSIEEKQVNENETESIVETEDEISEQARDLDRYEIKDNGDSITFIDDRDKEVTLKKNPKRVVSLYNSYLDLWNEMGGEVIGSVNPSDDLPIELSYSPELVGKANEPSMEKVISLAPDLVFISSFKNSKAMAGPLEEMGVGVLDFNIESKEEYFKLVRIFSLLLDDENLYEKFALDIEEKINNIISEVPEEEEKSKVIVLISSAKKIMVKDSDTITGEIIKDLGANNLADLSDIGGEEGEFSMEKLLEENPDYIFVVPMGSDLEAIEEKRKEELENNEVWSNLKAVKEGKYIILSKELFNFKPNYKYIEAYEAMAEYLYPETFK